MSTKKENASTAVMEKENKGKETKADEKTPRETVAEKPQAQAGPRITLDDSEILACYANFCRVSSTPEELILDLGLNPQPMARVDSTVKVAQRIIMNHYTAKRMLSALSMALHRHEQAFGVLETDILKRVQQQ